MTSEKEEMISGQLYDASDPQIVLERKQARSYLHRLNTTEYGDAIQYAEIISRLLPNCPSDIWIEPPIYTATPPKEFMQRRGVFEFGKPVSIGDDCWIGGRADPRINHIKRVRHEMVFR